MNTQVDKDQELRIQPIDELRAELDLSLPATIDAGDGDDPQMDKAADDYVARLLAPETGESPNKQEKRSAVESMFLSEQQDAARRSAMLNEPLKTLAHRADDGGEVASTLTDLRMRVEELDPCGGRLRSGLADAHGRKTSASVRPSSGTSAATSQPQPSSTPSSAP